MNVPVKLTLDWILPNSTDLIDFCQVLPSSARLYRSLLKTACAHTHTLTTKNPDYLTIRFSRYSFLFLRNVLFFIRAIPLDLDRIYIIPLNLLWSLFAPLHLKLKKCFIYRKEGCMLYNYTKEYNKLKKKYREGFQCVNREFY